MRPSKGLIQAYEVQDFAFKAIMTLKEQLTVGESLCVTKEDAQSIATLVNAWEKAQDRIRIHRGKPLPSASDVKRGRKLKSAPVGAIIEMHPSPQLPSPQEPQHEPDPDPEPERESVRTEIEPGNPADQI